MRFKSAVIISCLLAGCAGRPIPASNLDPSSEVPVDLAIDRSWSSNSDGYVYSVGYFTPEQVASKAWEAQRISSSRMVGFCESEQLVHRDVRWFEPIAIGEPRCGLVVYTFACSSRRPEWGSSLEYERKQALLNEPRRPLSAGCGEKSRSKLPTPVTETPAPRGVVISEWSDCKTIPDIHVGRFRLREVNYINARTLVSPSFVRAVLHPYPDPALHFSQAAADEQKVHIVDVVRPLPDDGNNIFIEQTFAAAGQSLCATLTARQGNNVWRKSVRADLPKGQDGKSSLGKALAQYDISKSLQLDLARHMGIKVSEEAASAP
jgi:hypothetical protein